MGQEAECTVRVGKKSSAGKAYLESEVLLVRGEQRIEIPFDRMKDVVVEGGTLVVRTEENETRLELGAQLAAQWARLIKEPKGLFEKLEVAPQARVAVVDIHDGLFLAALRERTNSVSDGRVPQGAPIIFFGAGDRESLKKVPLLRARMADDGVLWIVRPKGSKAVAESDVFEALKASQLVDTKVVAFSKTHTAHKAVIPAELRGQAVRRPPIVSLPPPPPGAEPKPKPKPVAKPAKAAKPAKKSGT